MTYPIAEIFHSLQGEGLFTGVPMMFCRLAGCNVGKYESPVGSGPLNVLRLHHLQHSICTSALGEQFLCDTNYLKSESLATEEILVQCYEEHLCITGGEPLLHDLVPLIREAQRAGKMVHIETSGTLDLGVLHGTEASAPWVTCSPKQGFLAKNIVYVDEWKFVVGESFSLEAFDQAFPPETLGSKPVFLQAITNNVDQIDRESIQRVLEILQKRPHYRLSAQLHKFLKLR